MRIETTNPQIQEYVWDNNDQHLDIIIKKGVTAKVIVSYNGIGKQRYMNISIEANASLTLLLKNEGNKANDLIQQVDCYQDSYCKLAYWELNDSDSKIDTRVNLRESGANIYLENIALSNSNKDYHMVVEHHKPYTNCEIVNYALVQKEAYYTMEAIGKINKGAYGSESHQSTRVLTIGDKHRSKVLPVLLIDENDVKASHATSVGQPDENQLYYIQTRGLTRQNALSLLTLGYLMPIAYLFDDEEYQASCKSEIEKKVGLHA